MKKTAAQRIEIDRPYAEANSLETVHTPLTHPQSFLFPSIRKEITEEFDKHRSEPDDYLTQAIIKLASKYHLTDHEIAGYLVEQPEILETEATIRLKIKELIQNNFLKKTTINSEELLQPNLSISPRIFTGRTESKKWIDKETKLGSFFLDSRQAYNNFFRKLKVEDKNTYNQIYDPESGEMQVRVNGKKCIMFSSNDYLGLSKHPSVLQALTNGINQYGHGSGASRILTGTTSAHRQLEIKIAEFKSTKDAIVFNTGFMTNLAMINMLNKNCTVFYDSLDHASIVDGIQMAGISSVRFRHNNAQDLKDKLEKHKDAPFKLIIIEGIYSMDGDIGIVREAVSLSKTYNALLAVDEAHSLGTLGSSGKGVEEHFNLDSEDIFFKIGTLGKAIGAEGGYIAGSSRFVDMMKYISRPFLFSTSLPSLTMIGAKTAFEVLQKNPTLSLSLQLKSKDLREKLKFLGFNIGNSCSHIIPIIVSDVDKLHVFQKKLESHGIFVSVVTYPAVPKKSSRLRICLSAAHTEEQISCLLNLLQNFGKQLGVI